MAVGYSPQAQDLMAGWQPQATKQDQAVVWQPQATKLDLMQQAKEQGVAPQATE